MNADEYRTIAYKVACKIVASILEGEEAPSAQQYVDTFKEIEELAMIARMAMQRVVDIEQQSEAPDATTPGADDEVG